MLVPVSWLREFISFSTPLEEVAERLTRAGLEVDGVRPLGASDQHVVVGRIIEQAKDVKRDGVHILTVSLGEKGNIKTISRAPNLIGSAIGRIVAVALDGARIFAGAGCGLTTVRAETSHGRQSQGVLLSERELGLGSDHTGLLFLPDGSPGEPVASLFQKHPRFGQDDVLELNILPNVARCLSILGVAREVAAVTRSGRIHQRLPRKLSVDARGLDASNRNRLVGGLCNRFSTAVISGIQVGSSPSYIQHRLALAGMDPINNVVDASNYVMLEIGQPTHAYDADHLPSLDIGVRLARENEVLQTLNQSEDEALALPEGAVVIVADDKAIGLAGIVGGGSSAISDRTHRILLESANFDAVAIRGSQAATKQITAASMRFARGVDPALTIQAIDRFVEILRESCPGVRVEKIRDDTLGSENVVQTIDFSLSDVNNALGTEFDAATCKSLLQLVEIECDVSDDGQALRAVVGTSRLDISSAPDLFEEIARLHGYDNIPSSFPIEPVAGQGRGRQISARERVRDAMVNAGLREVLTYSMTSLEMESRLFLGTSLRPGPYVRLINPQSVERSVLRRSLLPELLLCIERNQRFRADCHVFEIGTVFLPEQPGPGPNLPAQPWKLAIAMSGPIEPPSLHNPVVREASYFDATEAMTGVFKRLAISDVWFRPAAEPPFQPNACADVMCGTVKVGQVGLIHPLVARAFALPHIVAAAELDLGVLISLMREPPIAHDVPRFPPVDMDLSFVVAEDVLAGDLLAAARSAGGNDVLKASIFDVFRGGAVPLNHKAVGIRLVIGSFSRTLTIEEARGVAGQIVNFVREHFSAELRE